LLHGGLSANLQVAFEQYALKVFIAKKILCGNRNPIRLRVVQTTRLPKK
jgi:hypothetical protein